LVKVTGDLVSGIMLSRIAFWCAPDKQGKSKLQATFDGQPWLVKSREDWRRECGFTRHQYDRAVALLKAKKFIYTEIHLFGNKTAVYIRLNFKKLEQALSLVEGKSLLRGWEKGTTGSPKTGLPGIMKPDSPSTGLLQDHNKGTTGTPHKAGKATTLGGKVLAKEVLNKFQAEKQGMVAKALAAGKKGPEGLRREWVTLVPYFHDVGHTMLPLTSKEGGMLSAFGKRVGAARAADVLLWAVREWQGRFTRQVLEMHHQSLPNQPHPAYLLKYADAALSGWSAGPKQEGVAPVQPIATQPTVKKFVVK